LSPALIFLRKEYAGEDEEEVEYIKSVRFIVDPWEFTVPRARLLIQGRFYAVSPRDVPSSLG
jgi:hypothetical protein